MTDLLRVQQLDRRTREWSTIDRVDPERAALLDLTDPKGQIRLPKRIVDETDRVLHENDQARLYRESVAELARKEAGRKRTSGDDHDSAAFDRCHRFVVTLVGTGLPPDQRPVYEFEDIWPAVEEYRKHSRALMYGVFGATNRQLPITDRLLIEKGYISAGKRSNTYLS